MAEKLDRFTKHARQVLQIAQEEAVRLNHNYVGTEHLLLGLVKEENGLASKVLREVGRHGSLKSCAWSNGGPAQPAAALWQAYPDPAHQARHRGRG